MPGPSARYSSFRVPVETGTPPRRRRGSRVGSGRGERYGARRTPHTLTSLLLSKRDPLTLGSRLVIKEGFFTAAKLPRKMDLNCVPR